jgi:acetyl-CoA carboxylase beta subunit
LDERGRGRENEWFLQNEQKLLEEARKARAKREAERKAHETAEERRELKERHWMKCPKCGHDMKSESFEGVEIDRCTFCEGFFMDAGELEEVFAKKQDKRQSFLRRLLQI